MPFHQPRVYILAMPPAKECERRGLTDAFGERAAEGLWNAWHRDLLPPLFAESDLDVRLAYGPRSGMPTFRPYVQRPGQLCFIPARNLPARWARMVEVGLAATDKVIVAASDVPDLSMDLLHDCMAKLETVDVVIGQERESRFWCIGQRTWVPALWEYDFAEQPPLPGFADRARDLGLSVEIAYPSEDVNDADAVRALPARLDPARFPHTCAALAEMGVDGAA